MLSRLQAYWQMLTTNPLGFIIYMVYLAAVLLISLILHECAHGYVALRCGDNTAQMMGRLSLDPRKHLDPLGTACLLLLGFGWAKPVPVNPRNFKGDYRTDDFLVSIAGIVVNFTLFLLCSALSVGINGLIFGRETLSDFQQYYGTMAGFVNPYAETGYIASYISYGMDMTWLVEAAEVPWLLWVQKFLLMMAQVNLSLAIFNFLPIPPLDGYHLWNDLLFKGRFQLNANTFRWAQVALYVLLLTGALSEVLSWANSGVYGAFTHLWLMMAGYA